MSIAKNIAMERLMSFVFMVLDLFRVIFYWYSKGNRYSPVPQHLPVSVYKCGQIAGPQVEGIQCAEKGKNLILEVVYQ